MNLNQESLKLHEENRGKIEVVSKTKIKDMHDLAVVYTPELPNPAEKSTRMSLKYINILLRGIWLP
jgi:malate dehydrogenase (oxaloacetate-decarboxylating)